MAEPARPRAFVFDKNDGRPPLPGSLHTNRRLSQWVRFEPGESVAVHTGKAELGQGILTALAIIAAEELDVSLAQVRMVSATTVAGPDEGMTSGSLSIQDSGAAIRHVCAEIRAMAMGRLPQAAVAKVERGRFLASDGLCVGSYWTLLSRDDLDVEATAAFPPKHPDRHTLVGSATVPRLDLPEKVFGQARFIQDLRFDGMLHGRVVRPPSPAARLLTSPGEAAGLGGAPEGVTVVVDGRFVGVIAPGEQSAVQFASTLATRLRWDEPETLPAQDALRDFLVQAPSDRTVILDLGTDDDEAAGSSDHAAEYFKPYLAHASIGPSCGIARWDGRTLEVWSHSQGIQNLRDDVVVALRQEGRAIDKADIRIFHVEGSGCYGHNGADDAAFDAVLLALRAEGRHVRVLWSRADELTCSPLAPAQLVRLEARFEGDGTLRSWKHATWANGFSSRPGRATSPTLLAAGHRQCGTPPPIALNAPLAAGGGSERNAIPAYQVARTHVSNHRLTQMPIRTSAMRGLGAYANVFAIESFIDEIAHLTGSDPLELRKRHLKDDRAVAVMDAVIEASDWWKTAKEDRSPGTGHGFAWARYKNTGAWCAVIARVEVADKVRVLNLDLAVDVGQVIDADGVINQIEGGALQSVSWTLKEQVTFDRTRITSNEWLAYPILRFSEIPEIRVTLIDRPECEPLGAGEAAQGPVAAALGNAVFDALGVRVRTLPLSQANVIAAMEA